MSIHLTIIDALNLIRRVHSAQPDENDIERTITTTSRTLSRILQETNPTHIIAVFDHISDDRGWRANVLPTYKQNRKPMPSVLKNSLDAIQEKWWELGIDSLLSEGDEADDLISTLAVKVASHDGKVTIISTDKGYCQILSPNIQIRDYFQHRWLDAPFVEKEFGVAPNQLPDYWGLAGISSSQVSGVPGIGPKAAKEILTQFPDMEHAFNSEELPQKYRNKLQDNYELAKKCKQVAKLNTEMELGFNLQDIRYSPEEEPSE